ncbi:MAG: type II toxin-antitoxin system PemK/MazF family toxin [Vicinamibacteria bacterium]
MAGRLERGEIRLYRFPPPDKARPVVILTRMEAVRYLAKVTVAPVTSTIRGVASEVRLDVEDGMRQPCVVNLHNIITVAKAGIGRRVAKLSDPKLAEVCRAIAYSLGCEGL